MISELEIGVALSLFVMICAHSFSIRPASVRISPRYARRRRGPHA